MSDPHPFPTGRLVLGSVVAGVVAGSTAAVLTAFEVTVAILESDWTRAVQDGGPVIAIATPASLVGGLLWGLLVALLARPIARLSQRPTRRIVYVGLFSSGFVVLAVTALTAGVPPWRPLAALVAVGVAAACAWTAHPGFDRADP